MLSELVTKSKQMQSETGKHVDFCINKVAHALSDQELLNLANETGDARFIKQASRLANHGSEYTDDDTYRNHKSHHAAVAIIAEGFIKTASR